MLPVKKKPIQQQQQNPDTHKKGMNDQSEEIFINLQHVVRITSEKTR